MWRRNLLTAITLLFSGLTLAASSLEVGAWNPPSRCERSASGARYEILRQAFASDGSVYALLSVDFQKAYLLKFTKNGEPDKTFGNAGRVEVIENAQIRQGVAFHVDRDDRVYVGASAGNDPRERKAFLRRFTKDGKIDPTFNPQIIDSPSPYPDLLDAAITNVSTMLDGTLYVADSLSHLYHLDSSGQRILSWGAKGLLTLPTPAPTEIGPMTGEVVQVDRFFHAGKETDPVVQFHLVGSYHYVRREPQIAIHSYDVIGCLISSGANCYGFPQRYSEKSKYFVSELQEFNGPYHKGPVNSFVSFFFITGYQVVNGRVEMALLRMNGYLTLAPTNFGEKGVVHSSLKMGGFFFSDSDGATYHASLGEYFSAGASADSKNLFLWKVKGDGTSVEDFGVHGSAVIPVPETLLGARAGSVALGLDRSALVSGPCGTKQANADGCIFKIAPTGKLDFTFNGGFVSVAALFKERERFTPPMKFEPSRPCREDGIRLITKDTFAKQLQF